MSFEPSKAQATLLPAFNVSCGMEIRKQQNRNLHPIPDSDRQGERNPAVLLKAMVIQAPSQVHIQIEIKFLVFQVSNLRS